MTKGKNITIKDIASKLGVSFSTVSKALNDDPALSDHTKKRVLAIAREMGYYPNLMATGLRKKATRSIGVILNDLENPTRAYIIKKISMEIVKYGFTAFIFDSNYDEQIEQRNIVTIMSRVPECILISPVNKNYANLHLLEDLFAQTIILSQENKSIHTNYVHMNHIQGGYLAASTMLKMGHTNNLIVMEPNNYPSAIQFKIGVIQAYKDANLNINKKLFSYCFPNINGGEESVINFFNNNRNTLPKITGIIASNDYIAIGAYRAAHQLGLKIPEDLSVIGYDDLPIASLVSPQLSTLIYPKEKIAEQCVEILLAKLLRKDPRIYKYSFVPELKLRDSIKWISS